MIIAFLVMSMSLNMMEYIKTVPRPIYLKSIDSFKAGGSGVSVKTGLSSSTFKSKETESVETTKNTASTPEKVNKSNPNIDSNPKPPSKETSKVSQQEPVTTTSSTTTSSTTTSSTTTTNTQSKIQASTEDEKSSKTKSTNEKDESRKENHTIKGLSCAKYGGPSDDIASEMVYWSDIPSDADFVSPFKKKSREATQYLVFDPDGGGWNNIRMSMETVVLLAHAMGRTLVMPPAQGMYLLRKDKGKQNIHFSFADFFHLESLDVEHRGIDIITTEEFLLKEAMTGNIRNKTSGEIVFPPNNRTNWDGQDYQDLKVWLRNVLVTPLWRTDSCIAAFPASGDIADIQALEDAFADIKAGKVSRIPDSPEKPLAVDRSLTDRMNEAISGRKSLCLYDKEMQNTKILHFMCYHKMRVRLLTHFYTFLFFEDWKHQTWASRFVRDHLRYLDELQCAAARIVDAIRDKAVENGNADGDFDTFHIRRGDFQYKDTRQDAPVLLSNIQDKIPDNSTIYIATDERKKEFFEPFKQRYNIYFLDDFKHLIEGLNTNYYGMLDQLIASRGRTFVGTFYSTFTGYINRMRGYHSTKKKLDGYDLGTINSYYFHPKNRVNEMKIYKPLKATFSREYPVSWFDIDKGIEVP